MIYRHYNGALLSGWAERDALAVEIMDGLSMQFRAASAEWDGVIFDPFLHGAEGDDE